MKFLSFESPLTAAGVAVEGSKSALDDSKWPYTLHSCHPFSDATNRAYPSGENINLVILPLAMDFVVSVSTGGILCENGMFPE
jgi:hypothetical protein